MATEPIREILEHVAGVPPLPDRRGEIGRRATRRRRRDRAVLSVALVAVLAGGVAALEAVSDDGSVRSGAVASRRVDGGFEMSTSPTSSTEGLLDVDGIQARYSLTDQSVEGKDVPIGLQDGDLTVTGATLTDVPGQSARTGADELENTEVLVLIAASVSPEVTLVEAELPDGSSDEVVPANGVAVLVIAHGGIDLGGPISITAVSSAGTRRVDFEPFIQRPLTCETNPQTIVVDEPTGTDQTQPAGTRVLAPPLLAPCAIEGS